MNFPEKTRKDGGEYLCYGLGVCAAPSAPLHNDNKVNKKLLEYFETLMLLFILVKLF